MIARSTWGPRAGHTYRGGQFVFTCKLWQGYVLGSCTAVAALGLESSLLTALDAFVATEFAQPASTTARPDITATLLHARDGICTRQKGEWVAARLSTLTSPPRVSAPLTRAVALRQRLTGRVSLRSLAAQRRHVETDSPPVAPARASFPRAIPDLPAGAISMSDICVRFHDGETGRCSPQVVVVSGSRNARGKRRKNRGASGKLKLHVSPPLQRRNRR